MTEDANQDESLDRIVGSRMSIGRYNVLTKCSQCGGIIWIDHFPGEEEVAICIICAIKEAEIRQAMNPSDITEFLVAGLRHMHESGL